MLDVKRIREDFAGVKKAIEKRGQGSFGIDEIPSLDKRRRELLGIVEAMKNEQGTASKEIPKMKKEGKDTDELMKMLKGLSDKIKELDGEVAEVESKIKAAMLEIPNTPHESVPIGKDDSDNVEIRKIGEPVKFDFEEKAHWDIGTDLGILDFERAAKIAGARFTVYKGMGARLERSVMNFMLNLHTEKNGFTEFLVPYMVNRDAMIGTGQLPKFEDDMFKISDREFFMIPTAEVPLTNLKSNEIIQADQLPLYYTGFTPCWRKQAPQEGIQEAS